MMLHRESEQAKARSQSVDSGERVSRGRPLERWLPPVGNLAAGFTALCCLGVSAALSLASSIGATFLTEDATLKPLLLGTLVFTVMASVMTYRRRRNPWPALLTLVASVTIYSSIFVGVAAGAHADHGDHTGDAGNGDHMAHAGHGGLGHVGATRETLAWLGISLLIGAQVWDFWRVRGWRPPWRRARVAAL